MENRMILVVEDNPDSQDMIGRILRYYGIPFEIAESAEQALELVYQPFYAGLVIDLALPGMDGWTLLDALQNHPATTGLPCVAITAYYSPQLRQQAQQAGFAAFFPKPLEKTDFADVMQRIAAG